MGILKSVLYSAAVIALLLGLGALFFGVGEVKAFLGRLDPKTLPQQLVGGILLGSIYALVALGYTMVYGVLKLINFAHGEVFMLGAYASLFTSWALGYKDGRMPVSTPLNLVIMLVVSMVVCGIIGVLIELLAYRPMRNQPRIASLITAIGLSLLFQYGGALVLPVAPPPVIVEKVNPYSGADKVIILNLTKVDPDLSAAEVQAKAQMDSAVSAWESARDSGQPDTVVDPLFRAKNEAQSDHQQAQGKADSSNVKIRIPLGQLIMFVTTLVLMAILTWLVMKTSVGRAMRAASHDFDSASLMGINVSRVVTITFLIGSMLAGAGAMMQATFLNTSLTTQFGVQPGVKAFVAAVLGGIGNIPGAVLGGLLMGVAENLVAWAGFSQYKDAIAFIILIVVLLFRPGGLLGSAKVEKV